MTKLFTHENRNSAVRWLVLLALFLSLSAGSASAQTTQFTYQGNLRSLGGPANGSHDFQFRLFDTATVGTGTQHGPMVDRPNVSVNSGSVTVQIDFGACASCFNGADRFLEISVKRTVDTTYTTLSPRQQITSAPYSLKTVNATTADGLSLACVNCVTSSQIGSVNASVITGTLPVSSIPSGSGNYIQNTTTQQASSNFNISGNGTAGTLNVGTGTISPGRSVTVRRSGGAYINMEDPQNGPHELLLGADPNGGVVSVMTNEDLQLRAGGNSTKMLIKASGDIGVGTGNPDRDFTIERSSGGAFLNLKEFNPIIGFTNELLLGADSSGGIVSTVSNQDLQLRSGGNSTKMTIKASGDIGLGTSNPDRDLTVERSSGGAFLNLREFNPIIGFTHELLVGADSGGGVVSTISNDDLQLRSGGNSTKMIIKAGGNVGIGTTTPNAKLQVVGSAGDGLFSSSARNGIHGQTASGSDSGVWGENTGTGFGTVGSSANGIGVLGETSDATQFGGFFRNNAVGGTALKAEGTASVGVLQITGGSDVAESFEVDESSKPGMVVSIDSENPGKLRLARGDYDRRVAGVISGAKNLSPGMVLPNISGAKKSLPVALSGRVWVYCDATRYSIGPGDLLTTSTMPGYAMRVRNYMKAQGAIIGKAMTGLKSGRGLVLVLISLQ